MIKIFQGDCRKVLQEIAASSVQCVITSPPYWGLRDYDLPPLIWEHPDTLAYRRKTGDWGISCDHVWVEKSYKRKSNDSGKSPKQASNVGANNRDIPVRSDFCPHCHAWRGSLGLEPTPDLYVSHLVDVMSEVWRVLRDDGTLWLNLGDSYFGDSPTRKMSAENFSKEWDKTQTASRGGSRRSAARMNGLKPRDLCGIPWRVAFALQADGWYLRSDIIWAKGISFCPTYAGSCMPESVRNRPTKGHEYVFLLTKRRQYFYDQEAVREKSADPTRTNYAHGAKLDSSRNDKDNRNFGGGNGRNLRTVWAINHGSFPDAHFATFSLALVEPMIKAGTSERGCCPECGAGWERIVESTGHINKREVAHCPNNSPTKTDSTGWAPVTRSTDIWQPTCSCKAGDPIPATVLDPFSGAGTTLLMVDRLGRDGIGIDLSDKYCEMAEQRIVGDAPMFVQCEIVEWT